MQALSNPVYNGKQYNQVFVCATYPCCMVNEVQLEFDTTSKICTIIYWSSLVLYLLFVAFETVCSHKVSIQQVPTTSLNM